MDGSNSLTASNRLPMTLFADADQNASVDDDEVNLNPVEDD